MSLLVLGTVALDNVRTPSGVKKDLLGGSATHFAMSARLFTDVHLVAVIGQDFPAKHIQFLKRKKIHLASLKTNAGKSFRWEGEYKKGDLNTAITLATELGVLEHYEPQVTQRQKNISHVFLANYDPDVQIQLLHLIKQPRLVGLDSMNLWIDHKKESLLRLIKEVDLFVVNDTEAKALSGERNVIKAARTLRRYGPRLIVIKKGENGVLFYSDRFMFSFPAYPIEEVVDPTGAGDTFAGGLMGYLSKAKKLDEKTLKKALIYATTLASFNVEGFGTDRTAPLTLPKVHKRMKELIRFISV